MQAGVDATIMMNVPREGGANHEWSYIRLNGRNYHVDATWGLSGYGSLWYFLMTDERCETEYMPQEMVITSNYTQEHEHPEYKADDDTFSVLWDISFTGFDHDKHVLYGRGFDETGNNIEVTFDYEGY